MRVCSRLNDLFDDEINDSQDLRKMNFRGINPPIFVFAFFRFVFAVFCRSVCLMNRCGPNVAFPVETYLRSMFIK